MCTVQSLWLQVLCGQKSRKANVKAHNLSITSLNFTVVDGSPSLAKIKKNAVESGLFKNQGEKALEDKLYAN